MKKAVFTLRNSSRRYAIAASLTCILLQIVTPCPAADAPAKEVPLDGIASVISFSATDESSAVLLLSSDVELIARVLLVSHHGADWHKHAVDAPVRFKARRLGVIVQLLAHVATQVGEKVDTVRRKKWMAHFSTLAGGNDAIQKLLAQSGTSMRDLEYWFSNLQLCRIQLQYMSDKVQMPSQAELKKLFQEGDHSLAGASWKDAAKAFEKIVRNKKLQRIVSEWLARFEKQGNIRFP